MRWLDGITHSMEMNLSKFWEVVERLGEPGVLQSMGSKESDTTYQLNDKFLFLHFFGLTMQDLSYLIRDPNHALCIGSMES